MPGVTIVADITPNPVNKEGGFATMSTILQAHPDVDVVLGADTVVLGALAALRGRRQGAARPVPRRHRRRARSGGGRSRSGDGPYKASIALSSPVFGYAMGQHAADWLEGKSIPQAMDILPTALTGENLAAVRERTSPTRRRSMPTRRDATPISRCTATSATTRATST